MGKARFSGDRVTFAYGNTISSLSRVRLFMTPWTAAH